MKKTILVMAAAIAVSLTTNAQDLKTPTEKKFFGSISAGPAIPVGAFAAKSLEESEDAGLAKTGYQMNLQFGYQANSNFSVLLQTFYGRHTIDNTMFHEVGANIDHWQYYGILAGPALTVKAGKQQKTTFDFKTLVGWARVNSPLVSLAGSTVVQEEWADAMAIQAGIDIRYKLGGNLFLLGSTNYNYIRPKFNLKTNLGEPISQDKVEQKMGFMNINAGIGWRF